MKGTTRFAPASLIFYALTALMIVMTVVSAVSAVGWINRPFPGFLVYPFPSVGSFGRPDWPGYAAGIATLLLSRTAATGVRRIVRVSRFSRATTQ